MARAEYSGSGGYQSRRRDRIPESKTDRREKRGKKPEPSREKSQAPIFEVSNRDTAHLPNRFGLWADERLTGKTPQEVREILARERGQKPEPTLLEKLRKQIPVDENPTGVALKKQLGF